MSKIFSVWYAAFVLLFVAACGGGGGSNTLTIVTKPTVLATDAELGRVLAPGEATRFRVEVLDRDGAPIAGAEILFVAPDSAPNGAFAGAEAGRENYLVVLTDADGFAEATFVAGAESGAYYVEAISEVLDTAVAMGVTQQAGAPVPTVDAETATQRARARVSPGEQLYGALLLGTGDSVRPSQPENQIDAARERSITEPTWFFWIDGAPESKYEHPTRFLFIPGNGATIVEVKEVWPPAVRLAGEPAFGDLLPPSALNDALTIGVRIPAASGPRLARHRPTSCAVIIHGPPERFLRADAARAYDFFKNELGVDEIFAKRTFSGAFRPAKLSDLVGFLDFARNAGCEKIYLYMSTHGFNGGLSNRGIELNEESDTTDTVKVGVTYTAIAKLLEERFQGKEVCVVIDACYAGTAINDFQGRGFSGEIVTASNYKEESRAASFGFLGLNPRSFFSEAIFDCWEDFLDDGLTPNLRTEVLPWAMKEGGVRVNQPAPDSGVILAEPFPFAVPSVQLLVGERKSAGFNVPQGLRPEPDIAASEFEVNESICEILDGRVLPRRAKGSLLFIGKSEGFTTYVMTVRGNGLAYRGIGTITVGSPDPVTFPGSQVVPGGYAVPVLRIGGRLFPRLRFELNPGGPNCDSPEEQFPHWFGSDPVFPIAVVRGGTNDFDTSSWSAAEGGSITDQDATGCGFGKTSQIPASIIFVPKDSWDDYVGGAPK